jgi:hypothetical protein
LNTTGDNLTRGWARAVPDDSIVARVGDVNVSSIVNGNVVRALKLIQAAALPVPASDQYTLSRSRTTVPPDDTVIHCVCHVHTPKVVDRDTARSVEL